MTEEARPLQTMTVDEFWRSGLLQEVNRRLLHPIGVALSVIVDEDSGKATSFGQIWDYRADLDGMRYSEDELKDDDTKAKAAAFECRWAIALEQRQKLLGYVVQPIEATWPEADSLPPPRVDQKTQPDE